MYRATVEAVCHQRKAEGKDLFHKIDDLKNKGVADDIVEDLNQGRMLGNWSLHDGLEFSTEAERAPGSPESRRGCHPPG
jgi:hypothetical protein